jgi:hypothetical protein
VPRLPGCVLSRDLCVVQQCAEEKVRFGVGAGGRRDVDACGSGGGEVDSGTEPSSLYCLGACVSACVVQDLSPAAAVAASPQHHPLMVCVPCVPPPRFIAADPSSHCDF